MKNQPQWRLIAALVCVAVALESGVGIAAPATPARDPILGRWRGTSGCVKAPWNSACNDERVVYWFAPDPAARGRILVHGYKWQGDELVFMGNLSFRRAGKPARYTAPFSNSRVRIEWSYWFAGPDSLHGQLVDLNRKAIARTVRAVRDSDQTPPPEE